MALDKDKHWVSPTIEKSTLNFPLSLPDKIRVFEDRVLGWQLDIALRCYHTVPHGGFGALYIALSYFELIARYRAGSIDHNAAGKQFSDGFCNFSAFIGYSNDANYAKVRDLLYEGARCGLYHVGMTGHRVYIEGAKPHMFNFDAATQRLVIDPGQLIGAMIEHFKAYVAALRNGQQAALVTNFVTKFDHDILPQLN